MGRSLTSWILVLGVGAVPSDAAPQDITGDIEGRVTAIATGVVRFAYPMRADAEICDRGVRIRGQQTTWRGRRRGDLPSTCTTGVATVELRVVDGVVRDVDVVQPDDVPEVGAIHLGEVGAPEAASYLLSLARTPRGPGDRHDAVLAAVLASIDEVWRDLLALAQDQSTRRDVRAAALFWLGQEAGEAATVGIARIAADEQEEQEVRESAIFALSQRPGEEGIGPLMELARTAREAETRKTAMFWLAQSEDPRVLVFFEEILLGR